MSFNQKTIGENIRCIRQKRHMSLAALATQITAQGGKTVSGQAVSAWERGASSIPADQIYYIAKALECSISSLYYYSETSDKAKRIIEEIDELPEDEKDIILYEATGWSGNTHALIKFSALYMALPKSIREEIAYMGIHQYERSAEKGMIDSTAPSVDIEYITGEWKQIFLDGRRGG